MHILVILHLNTNAHTTRINTPPTFYKLHNICKITRYNRKHLILAYYGDTQIDPKHKMHTGQQVIATGGYQMEHEREITR